MPADDGGSEPLPDEPDRADDGADRRVDDAFARIVADWDREPDAGTAGVRRWPALEDLDPRTDEADRDTDRGADRGPDTEPGTTAAPDGDDRPPGGFRLGLGPPTPSPGPAAEPEGRHGEDRSDDAGHFVPPTPPPLPRPTGVRGAAWTGVAAGPLVLLIATVLGWRLPSLLTAVCVIGFVGGLVYLIAGMDDRRGDGWDDGAQL